MGGGAGSEEDSVIHVVDLRGFGRAPQGDAQVNRLDDAGRTGKEQALFPSGFLQLGATLVPAGAAVRSERYTCFQADEDQRGCLLDVLGVTGPVLAKGFRHCVEFARDGVLLFPGKDRSLDIVHSSSLWCRTGCEEHHAGNINHRFRLFSWASDSHSYHRAPFAFLLIRVLPLD